MESQPKELNQENNETRENEKVVSLSEAKAEAESVPVIGGKKRTRHKKRHNKTKRKYKSKHNKTKRKYKSNNKKRVRRNTKRKKRKSKK